MFKVTNIKVKGHMGQGQSAHWSRSNKDPKTKAGVLTTMSSCFIETICICTGGSYASLSVSDEKKNHTQYLEYSNQCCHAINNN